MLPVNKAMSETSNRSHYFLSNPCTCKTIISPVMFVKLGLTLREEQRLRVFENKVVRRIFGTKTKLKDNGESDIMLSYMHCILRLTELGILNRDY